MFVFPACLQLHGRMSGGEVPGSAPADSLDVHGKFKYLLLVPSIGCCHDYSFPRQCVDRALRDLAVEVHVLIQILKFGRSSKSDSRSSQVPRNIVTQGGCWTEFCSPVVVARGALENNRERFCTYSNLAPFPTSINVLFHLFRDLSSAISFRVEGMALADFQHRSWWCHTLPFSVSKSRKNATFVGSWLVLRASRFPWLSKA